MKKIRLKMCEVSGNGPDTTFEIVVLVNPTAMCRSDTILTSALKFSGEILEIEDEENSSSEPT